MSRNEFSCDCNVIHQESVDKVLKKLPDEDTFNKLADLFKLLEILPDVEFFLH